jgi:hypothetical protein
MHKVGILALCLGGLMAIDTAAIAQRKAISSSEAMGTFKTTDGANIIKVFPVGKGGLDRPGYNLQVEFFASLQLGPRGEARGNTGSLQGYASIAGDTATFTPDGMDADRCKITMKFTNPGSLVVNQIGGCGFISEQISTTGKYRKTSKTKPTFSQ